MTEVKASGRLDPKQTRRMEEVAGFMRGSPKSLDGGYTVRSATSSGTAPRRGPAGATDNWGSYAEALAAAGAEGIGWAAVEDYLGIVAVNVLHPIWGAIRTASVPDTEKEQRYATAWRPAFAAFDEAGLGGAGDVLVFWDSSEKYENGAFGAPFSVCPLPPAFCAALTCDYLKMFVYINMTNFCKRLRYQGFQEVLTYPVPTGKRGEQHFFSTYLSRPKLTLAGDTRMVRVHLGKPLMQQVLGEAMSVEIVAEAVKAQMRGRVEGTGEVSLLFLNGDGQRYVVSLPEDAA